MKKFYVLFKGLQDNRWGEVVEADLFQITNNQLKFFRIIDENYPSSDLCFKIFNWTEVISVADYICEVKSA